MGLPKAICSLYHIPAAALLQTGSRLAREALVCVFFLPAELLMPDADVTIQEVAGKSQQQAEHPQRAGTYPFLTSTF